MKFEFTATISIFALLIIIISIFAVIAWFINLAQLINCDWQEPWKGEIIHGIGLVPYAALITIWIPDR